MTKPDTWLGRIRLALSRHRVFLLFLGMVAASYAVRSLVCHRELAAIAATYRNLPALDGDASPFVPHLIESAMMYGYAQDVALGRGLPYRDRRLGGMEKIPTWRQFTNGLEYFLGWGYRLRNLLILRRTSDGAAEPYEDSPGFAAWARIQVRLWAATVAGFVFLWLVALRCPMPLALFGGLLHAVAPAAIARYTGQDIVRGTFCLPLVTASFALAAWHLRTPRAWKLGLLAATVFLAFATWDMCQIIFGLWAVHELLRLLLGGGAPPKRRRLWLAMYAAIVLAGLLVPYHQEHRLLASPLVLVALPLVVVGQHLAGRAWRVHVPAMLLAALLCLGAWRLAAGGMAENYGHFGNLMAAKLKFGNVKPADPVKLDFDARVIWTPGMHSADRMLLRLFFPMAIYGALVLLALGGDFRRAPPGWRRAAPRLLGVALLLATGLAANAYLRHQVDWALPLAVAPALAIPLLGATSRRLPQLGLPLFMTTAYFVAFFYIVRYYEFAALFLCVLLPLLAAQSWHSARWPGRIALIALLGFAFWVEAHRNWTIRRDYAGSYHEEAAGLVRWLRAEGIEDRPVMADFALGPALKAYCGAKIFIQPQFELPQVRDGYRQFVHEIFLGSEKGLREFCESRGAELLVFDRGWGPQAPMHPNSARYMAAAKVIPETAPSVILSHPAARRKLRGFYEFTPPKELAFVSRKYLLFKVISSDDFRRAKRYVRDAKAARGRGDLEHARILAKAAAHADPLSFEVRILHAEIFGRPADIRPRGY